MNIHGRNWLKKGAKHLLQFMLCSKHRVPSRTDGLHTANDPPVCPLKMPSHPNLSHKV